MNKSNLCAIGLFLLKYFEQEDAEGSGREGLARWASAALIHLAYADRIVNDRPW